MLVRPVGLPGSDEIGPDWLDSQVDMLARAVAQYLPKALEELDEQARDGDSGLVAAATVAREGLHAVGRLFHLFSFDPARHEPFWARLAEGDPGGLWAGLRRRLWWLPGIHQGDDGEPVAEVLPEIAVALEQARHEARSLLTAIRQQIAGRDFRFVPGMIALLDSPSDQQVLNEEYRVELDGAMRDSDAVGCGGNDHRAGPGRGCDPG